MAITPRQSQVVERIALGLTNQEIAAELCISPRTVKAYTDALRVALRVEKRSQIPKAYLVATGLNPLAAVAVEQSRVA